MLSWQRHCFFFLGERSEIPLARLGPLYVFAYTFYIYVCILRLYEYKIAMSYYTK
jgi:hypothetical protein